VKLVEAPVLRRVLFLLCGDEPGIAVKLRLSGFTDRFAASSPLDANNPSVKHLRIVTAYLKLTPAKRLVDDPVPKPARLKLGSLCIFLCDHSRGGEEPAKICHSDPANLACGVG
jgi:hypothetical protein